MATRSSQEQISLCIQRQEAEDRARSGSLLYLPLTREGEGNSFLEGPSRFLTFLVI